MTIEIKELVFNRRTGCDEYKPACVIDYNPYLYATIPEAAQAFYEAVRKTAESMGMDPDCEVHLRKPEDKPYGVEQWVVAWEAGPFEWAIWASGSMRGPWGYTEPHYSFDLCFTE